jgi:asparagine synthase (glutamine-hydrolysing)
MCGIFGFTGVRQAGLLRRMGDVIRHRGPDDDGFFEQDDFAMGMRRLSIIDLEHGEQPIVNEDKSVVVCYNGEIYNYVELMEDLQRKGHNFTTRCDTEVIVHAYEEYGLDCLEKFNGMFAFCLFDKQKRRLFLARDRAGQKPLYYWHKNGKFLFASEIKALLEADDVSREVNVPAIDSYLGLRYVPQPETLFRDIYVLPAAHFMTLDLGSNQLNIRRYWDIRLSTGPYLSDDYYKAALEERFNDSVRLTMRSDVPVGAYLSGGIDSSLVVAAMAQRTDKLNTFSIGFNSPIDETAQARELAGLLGTTHHEINVEPADFEDLGKCIRHLERPIGDILILAYYKLAEETSKHVKVVLSGEGADENFAGYSFHKIIQWTERYKKVMPRALNKNVVAPVMDGISVDTLDKFFDYPAYLGERGKAKLVDYVRRYHDRNLAENYVALRALWDLKERQGIYSREYRQYAREDWIQPPRDTQGPFLDRLLKLQFDDWLQDNLLPRQDKNTMAHSLEMRVPFLDHRLIELAFEMPPHLKVNKLTDKFVEREIAKKLLPKGNVKRNKNPFYFPMEFFFDNPQIRELIHMTLDPGRVRRRGYFDPLAVNFLIDQMNKTHEFLYVKQVMSLVILELWHMIFIDKEKLW